LVNGLDCACDVARVEALNVAAIITGFAGIVTAVGGVLLAIRAVRNKERKAAKEELDTVDDMLQSERKDRIQAELQNYNLRLKLAQHGIEVPDEPPNGHSSENLP